MRVLGLGTSSEQIENAAEVAVTLVLEDLNSVWERRRISTLGKVAKRFPNLGAN